MQTSAAVVVSYFARHIPLPSVLFFVCLSWLYRCSNGINTVNLSIFFNVATLILVWFPQWGNHTSINEATLKNASEKSLRTHKQSTSKQEPCKWFLVGTPYDIGYNLTIYVLYRQMSEASADGTRCNAICHWLRLNSFMNNRNRHRNGVKHVKNHYCYQCY